MKFQSQDIVGRINDQLNTLIQTLKTVRIEPYLHRRISSNEFRNKESIFKVINKIQDSAQPIIYSITCGNNNQRNDLINQFRIFHSEDKKRTRGIDRLNMAKFNDTNSRILYLGSVMGSFRDRIKNHLGDGNFRTYSLHLSKWDNNLNYTLKVAAFRIISSSDISLERNLVELVEQELWDKFRPVFGKRSGSA